MRGRDYNSQGESSLRGIGALLKAAIDQNAMSPHLRPHQALEFWAEAAGEQVAAVTQPEAVRGEILFVRAKSSVWVSELTFYKPEILERLNVKLGGNFIKDIRFQTGNSPATARRTPELTNPQERTLSSPPSPPRPALTLDPQERLNSLAKHTRSVLEWKRANGWTNCARCDALFEPVAAQSTLQAVKKKNSRRRAAGADLCPVCRLSTQRW